MSNITIERKNGYWEARNAWAKYRSTNGYDWMKPSGGSIEDNRLEELRFAFFAHLDTTAEPQRAKVNDWVLVDGFENPVKVVRVTDGRVYDKIGLVPSPYTIVPEPVPAPEPKTYTGNPKDWGEGVYETPDKTIKVIVMSNGNWLGVDDSLQIYPQNYSFVSDFRRISPDPAAAVRKCFDAISGKGGE